MNVDKSSSSSVAKFYSNTGWKASSEGKHIDFFLWEDERDVSFNYQSKCRQNVKKKLNGIEGVLLDAGSGPVQHPEFQSLHEQFSKTILFDVSKTAIESIPPRDQQTKFVASICDIPLQDGAVNAAISINVINHLEDQQQHKAVEEMLRVTKSGGRVIFVSYNPDRKLFGKMFPFNLIRTRYIDSSQTAWVRSKGLYWNAPTLDWWDQFREQAKVRKSPYRLFFVSDLKAIVPDNRFGKAILTVASFMQDFFPQLCLGVGAYYMVVLDKVE